MRRYANELEGLKLASEEPKLLKMYFQVFVSMLDLTLFLTESMLTILEVRSMNNYFALESILMQKELFQNERYRGMSCTTKVLYQLLLERKTYVAMKDWIDESGVCYVVYPKMQLMRDLGCTLYRLDQTMEELKKHDLICIIPTNGKPHQIYVTDVEGMKQEELLEKAMREMIRK